MWKPAWLVSPFVSHFGDLLRQSLGFPGSTVRRAEFV
jgi:hypothetical protein